MRLASPGLRLRRFRAGDDAALVALAGRALGPYGGHVERSLEHWRWSILARPGVEPEADVLVLATAADEIQGYGVLAADGTVLELFLDPVLVGDAREVAAGTLIAGLEARARERGLETIRLEQPRIDGRVREALVAAGYREEESSSLQVILVNVAEAIRRILAHRQGRFPHGWEPRFVLELAPGFYRPHPTQALLVTVGEGGMVVVSENPLASVERDVTIAMDLSCLTDLILRRTTFDQARGEARIAVRPASGEQDARTLCDFLGLRTPWYSPPADGR
jgi:hypothetical protein